VCRRRSATRPRAGREADALEVDVALEEAELLAERIS
jgi:hypothetical protein